MEYRDYRDNGDNRDNGDHTVVHVNPVRHQQNGEITDARAPTYMKYLICFREFMTTFMVLLAWLLFLGLLGTIIWVIIKHA